MIILIFWYSIGLIGALLSRAAFRSGSRANDFKLHPVTVKTVVFIMLWAVAGPVAVLGAATWWVCAFLEWHPIWTWKWVQPVKRVLNREL